MYAQGTGQRAFPVKCTGEHQFEFEEGKIKMTFDPTKQTMAFVQAGKSFAMQRQ